MPSPLALTILRANEGNAEALSSLAGRTFRDAYVNLIASDLIDDYVAMHFTPERQRTLLASSSEFFFIAWDGRSCVGYANLATTDSPPCVVGASPVELRRLYVDRAYWGAGVGPALMTVALNAARMLAHAGTVWLAVWEHNPRAITFYRRHRFVRVGTKPFPMGAVVQTDHVMTHPVELPVERPDAVTPESRGTQWP